MTSINFSSFQSSSATFLGYRDVFKNLPNIAFNATDFVNYDYNLFTGFKEDCEYIADHWNEISAGSKVGIVDPKDMHVLEIVPFVDFLIVDSIEMEAEFAKFGKPIIKIAEFPKFSPSFPQYLPEFDGKLTIGYHGNRQHIVSMFPHICDALFSLGNYFQVELRLIYNVEELGRVPDLFPDNISVKHIQWSPNSYNELVDCHFGVVPNLMPIAKNAHSKLSVSSFSLRRKMTIY